MSGTFLSRDKPHGFMGFCREEYGITSRKNNGRSLAGLIIKIVIKCYTGVTKVTLVFLNKKTKNMISTQISKKINNLYKKDQLARKNKNVSLKKLRKIDKESTRKLKTIVKEIGWPTISKVGKMASYNAWVIIQHTGDLVFAKKCLAEMKRNINNIDKKNIAYLTDKILVSEKKKQVYGTVVETKIVSGKCVTKPIPIKNIMGVEKRRKIMGLEPLALQIKNNERIFKKYFMGRE